MLDVHEGILSEFVEASRLGQANWLDWFGIEDGHVTMHIASERSGAHCPEAAKSWKKLNPKSVSASAKKWRQNNKDKVAAYSKAEETRKSSTNIEGTGERCRERAKAA